MSDDDFRKELMNPENSNTPSEKINSGNQEGQTEQQPEKIGGFDARDQQAEGKEKKVKNGSNKQDRIKSLLKPFDTSISVKDTELIGGLFPRGYVSVIVAPAGTGKSLFVQKTFTDLSNGGKFLEDSESGCFKDNEPERKCIILCGELGEQGLRERVKNFDFKHKSSNVCVIDQIKAESQGFSFMLNKREGCENIEALATTKPDIILIDSFTAFFTGKENDNSECNEVFGFLRRIAATYDIAVVVTHHSRKRLASEQGKPLTLDDVIGANAITRHVHTVLAIEYDKDSAQNIVKCIKCWGKKPKPFGFIVDHGFYGQESIRIYLYPGEIEIETEKASSNNTDKKQEWAERLIGFLIAKGKEGATLQEMLLVIGDTVNKDTVSRRIQRMTKNGELLRVEKGRYALSNDKLIHPESEQLDLDY